MNKTFYCINCNRDKPIEERRKWRGQIRCDPCVDKAAQADSVRLFKAALARVVQGGDAV